MSGSSICSRCGTTLMALSSDGICANCAALEIDVAATRVMSPEENAAAARIPSAPIAAPVASDEPRPGQRVGDYELIEEIARGGMGVVHKARQVSLNRTVALKTILAGTLAGSETLQRFRIEAEAAAALQHPNIVAIYEISEHEGQPFFSMEYIQGTDLADLVREQPLEPKRAARYLKAIAEAIHYAHERGILHRDLKPSNVLIDAFDQPRVTDFGLAKRLTEDSQVTTTGQLLGSPQYLPPEQLSVRRGAVGPHSDVYSLGAVLYHLVTGRAPFLAASLEQTLMQVIDAEPVAPRLLNPAVPPDLETISLKCLEKDAERRYRSAREVAEELQRFLADEPIHARPISAPEKVWRWCRRKPALAGTAAALVIAVAGGIAGVVSQWRRAEANAEAELAQRELAEARLYVADMEVAQHALAEGNLGAARVRVMAHRHDTNHHGFTWRYLWHQCQGQPHALLRGHAEEVRHVAFSPDGGRLASQSKDDVVKVWDLAASKEIVSINGVRKLAGFSGDGGRLLLGVRPDSLVAADATNGSVLRTLATECQPLAILPDGRRVAAGTKDGLKLYDIDTGEASVLARGDFEYRRADVTPMAVSANGNRAAVTSITNAGRSGLLTLQDLPGAAPLRVPISRSPSRLRFNAAGSVFALGGYDGYVGFWDLGASPLPAPKPTAGAASATVPEQVLLPAHSGSVWDLVWSPDEQWFATGSSDQTVKLWDHATRSLIGVLRGHEATVRCLAFSPDGSRLASGSKDTTVRLWDLNQPRAEHALTGVLYNQANRPQFSPDGGRLAILLSNRVHLIDPATSRVLTNLNTRRVPMGFTASGTHLLTLSRQRLTWWNVATAAPEREISLESAAERFHFATLSPDARLLALTFGGKSIDLFEVETGRHVRQFEEHKSRIQMIQFASNGLTFASLDLWGELRVWDIDSPRARGIVDLDKEVLHGLAVSPDGALVATGAVDADVRVWDARTLQPGPVLKGHRQFVWAMAWSPDGRELASAGADGTIKLWDVALGQELMTLRFTDQPAPGQDHRIYHMTFSPDGRTLAAYAVDGRLRLWRAPAWADIARVETAGR